ncbi:Peptidoglycan deacetylase [Colletotrichum trifolii]|uniref:Peptidoglycan deacetylase n=1 Tax=Colletotrichum trifolii TaxID=5466 RepID=A0A4R8QWL9_COLTR|nr:Peptidoglycan deacetylase [Colletotrichum trifolii]
MATERWPNGAKAAVSFTMDNLGEPLEIQLGLWPAEGPFGTHPSIKDCLPHVLETLSKYNVKGTYFAEAWSLNIYANQVKQMIRQGHEIGWHAYQHEICDKLSPEGEAENFQKSVDAAAAFGIKYSGFRPPGGTTTEDTFKLLNKHGFRYVSPLADKTAKKSSIVVAPFQWRNVDAFYYAPEFTALRQSYGEEGPVIDPKVFRDHLRTKISEAVRAGEHLVILFHPFLQTSGEKLEVLREIVERLGTDPDIWCAPCGEVVGWMQSHPESFPEVSS